LAPDNSDHLLESSSVIKKITYTPQKIAYYLYDTVSNDLLRVQLKPASVKVNGVALAEVKGDQAAGWNWQTLDKGGVVTIRQAKGNQVEIFFQPG
jgi:hypothetical protein